MLYIAAFVAGLCFGSFVNALVWRLRNKRDWVQERSECVHCGHALAARDLVPVLSWLLLRGKCRYCKKPIDDNPLTELITALVFVISVAAWPRPLEGLVLAGLITWLMMTILLVALSLYDLKYMLLPNKLILPLGGLVAAYTAVATIAEGPSYLVEAVGGLLAFGGLFYVLFQVSNGKWIGGGDVKLGFVLGAWLADYRLSLLAILIASFLGTLYIVAKAPFGKISRHQRLPFGPLLIIGTGVTTLAGTQILEWYINLLMPLT